VKTNDEHRVQVWHMFSSANAGIKSLRAMLPAEILIFKRLTADRLLRFRVRILHGGVDVYLL
jgi:hypothetical protein